MSEENENQTFKYSSGEHVLIRIHDLWKKLHMEVSMKNYYNWDIYLDRIWCELVNLMEENEYEEFYKDYQAVQEQIQKVSPIINELGESNGFKSASNTEINNFAKQYHLLMLKEQTIRKIQRKVEKKVIKTSTSDWD